MCVVRVWRARFARNLCHMRALCVFLRSLLKSLHDPHVCLYISWYGVLLLKPCSGHQLLSFVLFFYFCRPDLRFEVSPRFLTSTSRARLSIQIISAFPRSRVNITRHMIPDNERSKCQGLHAGSTKTWDGEREKRNGSAAFGYERAITGRETGRIPNHVPLP